MKRARLKSGELVKVVYESFDLGKAWYRTEQDLHTKQVAISDLEYLDTIDTEEVMSAAATLMCGTDLSQMKSEEIKDLADKCMNAAKYMRNRLSTHITNSSDGLR